MVLTAPAPFCSGNPSCSPECRQPPALESISKYHKKLFTGLGDGRGNQWGRSSGGGRGSDQWGGGGNGGRAGQKVIVLPARAEKLVHSKESWVAQKAAQKHKQVEGEDVEVRSSVVASTDLMRGNYPHTLRHRHTLRMSFAPCLLYTVAFRVPILEISSVLYLPRLFHCHPYG